MPRVDRTSGGACTDRASRGRDKINGFIYRVFPNGEVQYLHPKDGVYPEKVNAGRSGDNTNMRRIGQNQEPVQVKFTGKIPAEF